MPAGLQLAWPSVLVVIPLALVTACIVVVALATLAARKPATRQHCLAVLSQLTACIVALRSRQ